MSTNKYFNNFAYAREQDLLEELTIETIKIFGHDATISLLTIDATVALLIPNDLPIVPYPSPCSLFFMISAI